MDNYDIKDLQKVIEENWNKLEEGKKFSSGLKHLRLMGA